MIIQKPQPKKNRIPEEIITKEYIMNRKSITDLKNIIMIKKLNVMNGGTITAHKINLINFEEYKSLIIDNLYPSLDQEKDIDLISVTKYDNVFEGIINKEYIMTRNRVCDIINIVKIKKLNIKNGGEIKIKDIKPENLDKYIKLIVDILYPIKIIDQSNKQIKIYDELTEQIENNDEPIEFADRLIKQIEIHKLSTEQIKNNENDKAEVKFLNFDNNKISKIKYEETPEDIVYKKYIMNINKVNALYKEVMTKKLNIKNGGPIKVNDIKLDNLDEYKKIIIDTLYPS